ncbi:MAG: acyl-CoA thioesterase [Schleiferiaceae bacterium]|nr:acyl-CoA thioesterase [Schleiferiaceae bacterium]
MMKSTCSVRVRYAETDKMGVVYYGNYAQYFEVGRVELLRDAGLSYRKMEEDGVMLPVVNLEVNYKKSALYDDLLSIETEIVEKPSVKISFHHKIFNEKGELLVTGKVVLVFIDIATNKITKAPIHLIEALGY